MVEHKFELPVQPGVLSAILFIGLDIVTLGILDIVLSRMVCLVYYRKISHGRPVSVRSADIPGLTNYLLGKSFSLTNLAALAVKLSLLAIVFVVNLRIDSDNQYSTVRERRSAVFDFDPSDETLNRSVINTVRRRPERSKSCVEQDGDELTYYRLAFHLRDNVTLSSDAGALGVNTTGQYDIDDASVICTAPSVVHNTLPLAVVTGCTRRPSSGCLTVISREERRAVTARVIEDRPWTLDGGQPTHNLTRFETRGVHAMFPEYVDPTLTCLSTSVGIAAFGGVSRYRHCLLVSHNDTHTIVERWIAQPRRGAAPDSDEEEFVLEYPGAAFQGFVPIEQRVAARYLQVLFPFTTYRTLSGQLVADGAKFRGTDVVVRVKGEKNTVTTIPAWTVVLVGAAVIVVLIGRVLTFIALRKDRRPRFNTIDGLSSIVREECAPTGRSYDTGESAMLGLRYTAADNLRFGPLVGPEEGTRLRDGDEIS